MLSVGEHDVPPSLIPYERVIIYPPREKEQVPFTEHIERKYQ
jgi:hypothetical protein